MVYTPANLTTNVGVPKALASSRTMVCWVQVTALNSNASADLYVGGVDPVKKGTNTNVLASGLVGVRILKGTTQLFNPVSSVDYLDLSTMFFDVGTNGDGISITYGVR